MKFYQFFQRFGLTLMVALAILMMTIAFFVYSSETYVVFDNQYDQQIEINYLKDSLNEAREKRAAQRIENEEARLKDYEERGIKVKKLTSVEKAANKRYYEELDKREIEKENYNIAKNGEKIGPVGMLIANIYIFVFLAIAIAIILPIVKVILEQNFKSVVKIGVGLAALTLLYLIAYVSSGYSEDLLTKANESAQINSGALLIMTIVLMTVAGVGVIGGEIYRMTKK